LRDVTFRVSASQPACRITSRCPRNDGPILQERAQRNSKLRPSSALTTSSSNQPISSSGRNLPAIARRLGYSKFASADSLQTRESEEDTFLALPARRPGHCFGITDTPSAWSRPREPWPWPSPTDATHTLHTDISSTAQIARLSTTVPQVRRCRRSCCGGSDPC
jgi:hypothetical protein